MWDSIFSLYKKGCFATGLAIQFVNCNEHLQFIALLMTDRDCDTWYNKKLLHGIFWKK
jgi:hypothetical protein